MTDQNSYGFTETVRTAQPASILVTGLPDAPLVETALGVAIGLAEMCPQDGNGQVAVIDTHNGASEVFAGMAGEQPFHMHNWRGPHQPGRLVDALREVTAAGFSSVVISSIDSFWSGAGGVLAMVDAEKAEGRDGWSMPSSEHHRMVTTLSRLPIHVVVVCPQKERHAVDANGALVATAPVLDQRHGFSAEFGESLTVGIEGTVSVNSRYHGGQRHSLEQGMDGLYGHVQELVGWIEQGIPTAPSSDIQELLDQIDSVLHAEERLQFKTRLFAHPQVGLPNRWTADRLAAARRIWTEHTTPPAPEATEVVQVPDGTGKREWPEEVKTWAKEALSAPKKAEEDDDSWMDGPPADPTPSPTVSIISALQAPEDHVPTFDDFATVCEDLKIDSAEVYESMWEYLDSIDLSVPAEIRIGTQEETYEWLEGNAPRVLIIACEELAAAEIAPVAGDIEREMAIFLNGPDA